MHNSYISRKRGSPSRHCPVKLSPFSFIYRPSYVYRCFPLIPGRVKNACTLRLSASAECGPLKDTKAFANCDLPPLRHIEKLNWNLKIKFIYNFILLFKFFFQIFLNFFTFILKSHAHIQGDCVHLVNIKIEILN